MSCVQNSNTNGLRPERTYNTNTNQLTSSTGCAYDAAGNTTTDCSTAAAHTFQWDAEGRVSPVDSGNTYAFTYNAVGNRVQWANPGGAAQYMFDPAGNWLGVAGEYSVLWWGRTFLAAYEATGALFNHLNGLGSSSVMTKHDGTPAEDMLFYPWGDVWQSWGTGGYNFANQPFYDTDTYTSPSMFRFYSMGLGRWLSPDPLGGDVTNPQSLNRYGYALNNPTTLEDPLGLTAAQCNDPSYAAGDASCGTPPWFPGTGPTGSASSSGGVWAPGWGPPPTALTGTLLAAEQAQAEAAYESWVSAMELTGGSYTEWGAEGPVTYTIGWSIASGPFWIGPNGVVVNNQWAMEAGLPGLPGPQIDTGIDWGALATASGIDYQRHQIGSFLNALNPMPRLKAVAKWYLCGSSPGGAVENYMEFGATKGAMLGAWAGDAGFGLPTVGLGAVPGAIAGGVVGGVAGAGGGALLGVAAAGVCSAAGVYGPQR
jgi:RHS repeat-associated protein